MAAGSKANHEGASTGSGRGHFLARPLDSLVFLLPFIVFYEAVAFASHPENPELSDRVIAFQFLRMFFELFGSSAIYLPGLAVIVILFATHIASRRPWRVRGRSVGFLYLEALAWAIPLIMLNGMTRMSGTGERLADSNLLNEGSNLLNDLALCVGAGIYEELVFRLALISLLVIIGADILRFSKSATLVGAVLVGAFVFSLHHHPPFGSDPFEASRFVFRALAGVYLGGIFVYRGYGPAAGAHIAHNVLVLTVVS